MADYSDDSFETYKFVRIAELLGFENNFNLRLRLSSARVYSFETFLKSYIRESKSFVKHVQKIYTPSKTKFYKWFVEDETKRTLGCERIPDLAIAFTNKKNLFIIPVEVKRIATVHDRIQLVSYLDCAMKYNSKYWYDEAATMNVILVAYAASEKLKATHIADIIEILRTDLKLDVNVLKKINKIMKSIISNVSKISKITKTIRKEIKRTKLTIEKLIIIGVLLYIGLKMPEIIANNKVVNVATKTLIEELEQIPLEDIKDSIDELPPEIIPYLSPRLIPYLNDEQVKALTPKQLIYLTPEQIKHLTPEQIKHLTPEQLKHLTYEQLLKVDEKELKKLYKYLKERFEES